MNAADWSERYPLIVEDAARIKGTAIIDAEVVCAGKDGVPDFDRLHGRLFDHLAVACAFDLLMLNGDDLRRKTFAERKATLRKLLKHEPNGIQYVEHIEGDAKWQVYQRARGPGSVAEMPVRAILQQKEVPVDVYWCP